MKLISKPIFLTFRIRKKISIDIHRYVHLIFVVGVIGVMLVFAIHPTLTKVRKGKYFNYFLWNTTTTRLQILWTIVILSTLTWALILGFKSGETS